MSKTFAIDYDATWTADPEAFAAIARMLRARGHRVILVTARVSGHGEVQREAGAHVDRVLFSGAAYKREHVEANGESVDIWVDDNPGMIGPDIPMGPPVMEWGRLCSRVRPGSSAVARDLVMRGWVFGLAYESEEEWILPMTRPLGGEH